MIRVGSVVIRVEDLEAQATFWERALHYRRRPGDSDDFLILEPIDGPGPNISLDRLYSERHLPPRIHLDLYAEDAENEIGRLLDLGASKVEWDGLPADSDYVILEDPEGNRFCVIDKGD